LKGDDLKSLLSQLGGGWIVVEEHHLEKLFRSRDLLEREVFAAQAAGCL
jgi:hypothetical protein